MEKIIAQSNRIAPHPLIYTLPNGMRVVSQHCESDIIYCGFLVDVGTRDETTHEHGMAHYVEHMLFKGTQKRSARQIINSIESIGGELNAYTTKEETAIYGACMKEDFKRIVELLYDMVFDSVFAENERKKELSVICDEIESYNDSPSELIFDDFESLIYGEHTLGNAILGSKESISSFTSDTLSAFHRKHYTPERIVFFLQGDVPYPHIEHTLQTLLQKYTPHPVSGYKRQGVDRMNRRLQQEFDKETHQTHFVCGGQAYSLHEPERLGLYLLNNILGGPGMNSRLNLALREKSGLVYTVESLYIPLSDTGYWEVYFGCDPENVTRCEHLVKTELYRLCTTPITPQALKRYKRQIKGQMAIAAQNTENNALGMGKSILRMGQFEPWQETYRKIETFTAEQLQNIAQHIYHSDNINTLKYV